MQNNNNNELASPRTLAGHLRYNVDIAKWTQYSRFNFLIRQTEPATRRFVRVCTLYTHKLKCYMMSLAFIFCCCPFFCFVWIRFQKSMQIQNIQPTQVVYFSSIDKDLMSAAAAAAAVSAATQNNFFNIYSSWTP